MYSQTVCGLSAGTRFYLQVQSSENRLLVDDMSHCFQFYSRRNSSLKQKQQKRNVNSGSVYIKEQRRGPKQFSTIVLLSILPLTRDYYTSTKEELLSSRLQRTTHMSSICPSLVDLYFQIAQGCRGTLRSVKVGARTTVWTGSVVVGNNLTGRD